LFEFTDFLGFVVVVQFEDVHRESKLHRSISVAAVVASVAKELHSRVSQLESESLESESLRLLAQRRVEAAMEVERAQRMLTEQQQIAEEEGRYRHEVFFFSIDLLVDVFFNF
jgi:hypothetical protein